MSGGFLSRFRIRRDAEGASSNPTSGHEVAHTIQQTETADQETLPGMPDKVDSSNLPAQGNEVAMEELQLSHEGLTLEEEAQAGVVENVSQQYTMFKEDGTPLRAQVDTGPGEQDDPDDLSSNDTDGDETAMAIEKVELATEKIERVLKSEPEPGDPPPDGLTQGGEDGNADYEGTPVARYNLENAWPSKAPSEEDDEALSSTLEPIAETEQSGVIVFLSPDMKTELGEAFDDDPDLDGLI